MTNRKGPGTGARGQQDWKHQEIILCYDPILDMDKLRTQRWDMSYKVANVPGYRLYAGPWLISCAFLQDIPSLFSLRSVAKSLPAIIILNCEPLRCRFFSYDTKSMIPFKSDELGIIKIKNGFKRHS